MSNQNSFCGVQNIIFIIVSREVTTHILTKHILLFFFLNNVIAYKIVTKSRNYSAIPLRDLYLHITGTETVDITYNICRCQHL